MSLFQNFQSRLSYQQRHIFHTVCKDIEQWQDGNIEDLLVPIHGPHKEDVVKAFQEFLDRYYQIKHKLKNYEQFKPLHKGGHHTPSIDAKQDRALLGSCPVASESTRCCGLQTLDLVQGCSFGCHYCSIQHFFPRPVATSAQQLRNYLHSLNLDPQKLYHWGTGQSSDSLLWGDKYQHLSVLKEFLYEHPNVILELKTKSNHIKDLLGPLPPNIIVTWSLNPQVIIDAEEPGTASLMERLSAAKKIHDQKTQVGFHFHPMMIYEGWESDYTELAKYLVDHFDANQVALVSMGTLTFSTKVIKKIRSSSFHTKVTQMPLEDIAGKLSYPMAWKKKMFSTLYDSLRPWHQDVYFYLCMEHESLWMDVFGKEYNSNKSFELGMINHYHNSVFGHKRP